MERLQRLEETLVPEHIKDAKGDQLSLVDHRTGKSVNITVKESKDCYFVDAKDVGKLKDSQG